MPSYYRKRDRVALLDGDESWERPNSEVDPMPRKCLGCSKRFTAFGKTNRICKRCKKINENFSAEEETGIPRK